MDALKKTGELRVKDVDGVDQLTVLPNYLFGQSGDAIFKSN